MKHNYKILTVLFIALSFTLSFGQAAIVGQWDFDDSGDLTKATVGTALTSYGTPTASTGIKDGDGAVLLENGDYYKAPVAIVASGAGSLINTYTLVMDIKVDVQDGYNCLMQTNLANNEDGDYFLTANKKIGCPGANYSSSVFREKAWVRTVLVVEEISATEVSVDIYLDGKTVMDSSQGAVDSRTALDAHVLLFCDDNGEEKPTDVTKIVLYDDALSSAQIAALGNAGDMIVGQWDFDDSGNLGKATVGTDLTLTGTVTSSTGPSAGNGAALLEDGDYFTAVVPITPNGAGSLVNTYTLLMDIKIDAFSGSYASLLQTKIANNNDGDLFAVSDGSMGNSDIGYSGNIFSTATWYRMVFVVEENSSTDVSSKMYLDGTLAYTGNAQSVDSRLGLDTEVHLFLDDGNEEMPTDVSQIVLYNYALTAAEVSALGSVSASLPVELTSFTAVSSNDAVLLNWATATEVNNYGFDVESSNDNVEWSKIGFVSGHGNSNTPNSYIFIATEGAKYYRLKQIDIDGGFEYSEVVEVEGSLSYKLSQNHPNPFNPSTTVNFTLPQAVRASITIYNALGQRVMEVANKEFSAGNHSVNIDASDLSSGMYFYRLETPEFSKTMKMMLLK